ncbi:MAG TPA: c-type cytochrome [Noviherbaspirillum sp.]
MKFKNGRLSVVIAAGALVMSSAVLASDDVPVVKAAVTIDSDAAESLARREGCLKCHGATKDKEGPSFRKIASRFRGKPDAEEKVLKHLRSGDMVKFSDGEEEEHRILRSQDADAVANMIRWILSR